MVTPISWEKMACLPQNKKTLLWAVFLEAFIIAPPFLDMCLDIYGAWINQKKSFDWDIILENIALFANIVFFNTKSWSWIRLGVVMNVLRFVLMVCWNQHMASIEMYIFSVDVVLITCWNICMTVILGGHAPAEPVNSSFRGNPYLITRLYSFKYKVTCVVHVSRTWISRYILYLIITDVCLLIINLY